MIPGDALQHLQEARDSFFGWLEASTWCVVVGIVMEGPEVFHDFADVVKGTSKSANPWVKLVACVGWLLIVLGVVGEGYYEAKVSRADGGIQAYEHSRVGDIGNEADAVSGKLQNAVNQASTALSKSGIAETIAEGATTKAELASRRSALAESAALNTKKEADSFERDIATAKKRAADAEAHLAEAVTRATEATTALNRLTLPRTLLHAAELTDSLRPFTGTEYKFVGVFGDHESQQVVKQIEACLNSAGWKRVKSEIRINVPAFNVLGGDNGNVDLSAASGVNISVDSPQTNDSLQKLPPEQWPSIVRAAVTLMKAFFQDCLRRKT